MAPAAACAEEPAAKKRWTASGSGSSSSPAIAQPGARDDQPRAVAGEALQVADLLGVLALGGALGREVVLERHLDEDGAAGARDLGEQRRRVGDVLEHVREDAEVVGAVGERAGAGRRRARRSRSRAARGDRDGRLR